MGGSIPPLFYSQGAASMGAARTSFPKKGGRRPDNLLINMFKPFKAILIDCPRVFKNLKNILIITIYIWYIFFYFQF
jgi:hypothetical protein